MKNLILLAALLSATTMYAAAVATVAQSDTTVIASTVPAKTVPSHKETHKDATKTKTHRRRLTTHKAKKASTLSGKTATPTVEPTVAAPATEVIHGVTQK